MSSSKPLVDVQDLKVVFHGERNVTALDGVSIRLARGESVGFVGETGSGKSTLAFTVLRLLPRHAHIASGAVIFNDVNLLELSEDEMNRIRGGRIAMIFQDPRNYLDPLMTVGDQVAEVIRLHQNVPGKVARQRAVDSLRSVGIPGPEAILNYYPHQLSGGMCQRAVIATAISCNPMLLIADEPTSALDVTVQAQIVDLLREIVKRKALSLLLITHDLGVVAQLCERAYVIQKGKIVEDGPLRHLFTDPTQPYTKRMLAAYSSLTTSDGHN